MCGGSYLYGTVVDSCDVYIIVFFRTVYYRIIVWYYSVLFEVFVYYSGKIRLSFQDKGDRFLYNVLQFVIIMYMNEDLNKVKFKVMIYSYI